MKDNGKKKDPISGTQGDPHAIRGGEEGFKLHSDANGDRTLESKSRSGESERLGICGTDGERSKNRWRSEADGKVVNELIQVTQDCLSAMEVSIEAGKAYLERLESIRSSIQSSSDSEN